MPTICLIPGDGVGQEVIPAAAQVLAAVAPDLTFVEAEAGWNCFQRRGTALPDETLAAVGAADATLFGATQSPSTPVEGYRSPILALRKHFDLYANLRPVESQFPGTWREAKSESPAAELGHRTDQVPGNSKPVNLLIVRENTECLYVGRERMDGDAAIAERVITRRASQRIAHVAFQQARLRAEGRTLQVAGGKLSAQMTNLPIYQSTSSPIHHPTVTIVHKANVLKLTDGLFRETCLEVARDYPDVQVNEMLVDAAAMWLVKDPGRFDVIVTTNLFGDILSDLAAGLVGGLGVAPSANVGAGRVAVFEPVHGSAPDIAGRGIANPVGAILSAAMLLDHIGRPEAAIRVRQAVADTLACGTMTSDLGGAASTDQVTAAVNERIISSGDQQARQRSALSILHRRRTSVNRSRQQLTNK